jgi:hypothetical protein
MRTLMKCTVGTAVEMGLVDLAVQAVDGTKVPGNASRRRSLSWRHRTKGETILLHRVYPNS